MHSWEVTWNLVFIFSPIVVLISLRIKAEWHVIFTCEVGDRTLIDCMYVYFWDGAATTGDFT